MVDKPGYTTRLGSVDNGRIVNAEEVGTADATLEILLLPHVCYLLSDDFTNVFDNHVAGRDVLHRVQAPIMNGGASKLDRFLALLKLIKAHNVRVGGEHLLLVVQPNNETTIVNAVRT